MTLPCIRFRSALDVMQECLENIEDPLTAEEERALVALIPVCSDLISTVESWSEDDEYNEDV